MLVSQHCYTKNCTIQVRAIHDYKAIYKMSISEEDVRTESKFFYLNGNYET